MNFFQLPTYILFVVIFIMIILFNWIGYRYKKRQLQKYPGQIHEGMGSVEGSILGVMSLLMGFTFSVAVSKFESRRHLIVEEANDIGTAILRCDLYPDSIRIPLRADFREYVQSRINYYNAGLDEIKMHEEIEKGELVSGRIWKRVAFYSSDPEFRLRSQQMNTTLNDMIDIVRMYYHLRHIHDKSYSYVFNLRLNKYDVLTLTPKTNNKCQLHIDVSPYYDQSSFDQLRTRIDQHKYATYKFAKGRKFKIIIELLQPY